MSDRNSELMKNTIILSVGQIVPKLIAIFILPLLTTFLTKKDYGLYELTLSVASFAIPLLSVQIQQGVFRFLLDQDTDKKAIITTSFSFIVVVFFVYAIPIIIAWTVYSTDVILAVVFFGSYLAEVLLNWSGQVMRGLGDNIGYSIAYIIYSVVYIVSLVIILIAKSFLNAKDVAFAMICAYLMAFLFSIYKAKIISYCNIKCIHIEILKKLLGYSAPMVISSIALWVVNLSDRFFVSGILGIEMTAMYSVANKIPNLFNSIYNIFNLAWTENTSKLTRGEKNSGYYSEFFKDFYRIMVGMIIILTTASPLLFRILINSRYADGYWLMSWLFVGVFFSSLVSFFGSIYVGEKRTKDVGISSAVGAVINVLINLFFMKKCGIIIAAISTIVSYFIICVYRAIDIKKYVSIVYDRSTIVFGIAVVVLIATLNNSFSIVATVISIIISIGYNVVFNRHFVRGFVKKILTKINR